MIKRVLSKEIASASRLFCLMESLLTDKILSISELIIAAPPYFVNSLNLLKKTVFFNKFVNYPVNAIIILINRP